MPSPATDRSRAGQAGLLFLPRSRNRPDSGSGFCRSEAPVPRRVRPGPRCDGLPVILAAFGGPSPSLRPNRLGSRPEDGSREVAEAADTAMNELCFPVEALGDFALVGGTPHAADLPGLLCHPDPSSPSPKARILEKCPANLQEPPICPPNRPQVSFNESSNCVKSQSLLEMGSRRRL